MDAYLRKPLDAKQLLALIDLLQADRKHAAEPLAS
jgi:DNA-binding response OmpR family regulator